MTAAASMPTIKTVHQETAVTSSMSSQDFLLNIRDLLVCNIVPCDDLMKRLLDDNLLLPSVVDEIKVRLYWRKF